MRAAANSIASGNPSRCTQISAMVRAFVAVIWKLGFTLRARSRKRLTAAYWERTSIVRECLRSGSASGRTGNSCSSRTCNAVRLVTRNLRCWQLLSSSESFGADITTCSKLSSTSNIGISRMNVFSNSRSGCSPDSFSPSD